MSGFQIIWSIVGDWGEGLLGPSLGLALRARILLCRMSREKLLPAIFSNLGSFAAKRSYPDLDGRYKKARARRAFLYLAERESASVELVIVRNCSPLSSYPLSFIALLVFT